MYKYSHNGFRSNTPINWCFCRSVSYSPPNNVTHTNTQTHTCIRAGYVASVIKAVSTGQLYKLYFQRFLNVPTKYVQLMSGVI